MRYCNVVLFKSIGILLLILITINCVSAADVYTWNYTGATIPEVSSNFIFNAWLSSGAVPTNGQEYEVIISNFTWEGGTRTDGGSPVGSIEWCGYTWTKRNMTLTQPGPNYWNSSNVWVDGNNKLHLKISHVGSRWYCAELDSADTFLRGNFSYTVETSLKIDPNIVFAGFTYYNDNNEIDIEFGNWESAWTNNLWFSTQPIATPGNSKNITYYNPVGYNVSHHKISWTASKISWMSMIGTPESDNVPSGTSSWNTIFSSVTSASRFLDVNDSKPQYVNVTISSAPAYNSTISTSDLTGLWLLTSNANDTNPGTKHHGTVTGALTYSSKGSYFDGTDYVTVADFASPKWISFDLNTTLRTQDVMNHWNWANKYSFSLMTTDTGALWLIVSGDGTTDVTGTVANVIKANKEQHIDMKIASSNVYVYVDGILVLTVPIGAVDLYNTDGVYLFGGVNYEANYVGYLKNIRFYSAAPTDLARSRVQYGGTGIFLKSQPDGTWIPYTGTRVQLPNIGDFVAGVSYIDTSTTPSAHDVTIFEKYDYASIVSYSPVDTTPNIYRGSNQIFTANISQSDNVQWLVNGAVVETDSSTTTASYTYTSSTANTFNITARTPDTQQVWSLTVDTNDIASFLPVDTTPTVTNGSSQSFSATFDTTNTARWYVNGTLKQTNVSVSTASYLYVPTSRGYKNVTVNGYDDSQMWILLVDANSYTSYNPADTVPVILNGSNQEFNITLTNPAKVTWKVNGSTVQTNSSVTSASYDYHSSVAGYYNISAITPDDIQTWIVQVYDEDELVITSSLPVDTTPSIEYDSSQSFSATTNKKSTISWLVDSVTQESTPNIYTDSFVFGSGEGTGDYNITVKVLNGTDIITESWTLTIAQDNSTAWSRIGEDLEEDVNSTFDIAGTLLIVILGTAILIILMGLFTNKIEIETAIIAMLMVVLCSIVLVVGIVLLNEMYGLMV